MRAAEARSCIDLLPLLMLLISAAVAVTTVQGCDNVAVGAPMSLVLNCSNLSPVFTLNFSGLAQSQAVDGCIPALSVVDTAAGGLVLRCEGDAGNHCFAVEVLFAVSLNSTSGNLVTIEMLPENVNVIVKYNQTSPLNLAGGTGSLVYVTTADPGSCKVRVALEGTQLVMSSRSTVIIAHGLLVNAVLILNSTGVSGAGTLITVYGPASDILVVAHNTTVVGGIRAVASNFYPISNVSSYLFDSYFELYDSRWIASRDSDVDNVSITAVNCVLVFTQSEWIFGRGNVNRSSFALNNSTARSPKDGKLILSKTNLSNSGVVVEDSVITGTGLLRLLQSFSDKLSSLVNCTVTLQRSSIELHASLVVCCDNGILTHVAVVVIESNVSLDAKSFLVAGGVISHIHLFLHQLSLSLSNLSSVVSTKDSATGIELIISSSTLQLTLSSSFCSVFVALTSVSVDIHSSQVVMQSLSSSFASFSVSGVSFTIDGSQILIANNSTLVSSFLTLRAADITVRDSAITTTFSNIVSAPSMSLLSLHLLSTNLSIDFAPTLGWLMWSGMVSSAAVPSAVEIDNVAIRWGGSSPVPVPVWPEPSVVTLVGCANTICAPPSPSSACRSTRPLRFCDFENKSATVFEASPASSACSSQVRCVAESTSTESRNVGASVIIVSLAASVFSSPTVMSGIQAITQRSAVKHMCDSIADRDPGADFVFSPLSDSASNPFGVTIGALGDVLMFAGGSLVSSLLLALIFAIATEAMSMLQNPRFWLQKVQVQPSAAMRLPGSLYAPLGLVLQPLIMACVVLIVSPWRSVASVVLGVLVQALIIGLLSMLLLRIRDGRKNLLTVWRTTRAPRDGSTFGTVLRCMVSLFGDRYECVPRSSRKSDVTHFERYGVVLASYAANREWFVAAEVLAAAVSGALSGVASGADPSLFCRPDLTDSFSWALAALYVLQLMVVAGVRPYSSHFGNTQSGMSSLFAAVCLILQSLSPDSLAISVLTWAQSALGFVPLLIFLLPKAMAQYLRFGWCRCTAEADEESTASSRLLLLASLGDHKKASAACAQLRCLNAPSVALEVIVKAICAARHRPHTSTVLGAL